MATDLVAGYATEVASSVVVGILAFIVGSFRKELLLRLRTRETRKYWAALRSRGVTVVLGSHLTVLGGGHSGGTHRPVGNDVILDFEPFGLVGFGDVRALLEIQRHLQLLGIEDVRITDSRHIEDDRGRNLILIGGPDVNSVTALAMDSGRLPVVFADDSGGRTVMTVTAGGRASSYRPEFNGGSVLSRDVGFVAQMSSPYVEEAVAVLLVGVYGAATFAASKLVTSAAGVSRLRRVGSSRCLAVFSTSVSQGGDVSKPRIEDCQALT